MAGLQITQLKPNPTGKDRNRSGSVTAAQLGAEWVDFKNVGAAVVSIAGLELYHRTFGRGDAKPEWAKITSFTGSLASRKVLRIHSGQTRELSNLHTDDLIGADFHLFTGHDAYVWNNAEGDTAGLWWPASQTWEDQATYGPYPPEGVILIRSGAKLVPAGAALRI